MPGPNRTPRSNAPALFESLEPRRLMYDITRGTFSASASDGPTVLTTSEALVPYAIRPDGAGDWIRRLYGDELAGANRYTTFTDPKDGATYVIAFGTFALDDGTTAAALLFRQLADGSLTDRQLVYRNLEEAIFTKIVSFFSPDGRVHVAGLNHVGGVVMFFQTGGRNDDGTWTWGADNISKNHFFPQGITPPNWTSEPTAYVTPWGGLNIAVIDDNRDLQVMWWAPGMQYWATDNLSVLNRLPDLNYFVAPTSFVSPSGDVNVVAVAANAAAFSPGHVFVAWWSPQTDRWTPADMDKQFAGEQIFHPTAYVTPWGGLNIAGNTVDGGVGVYWWTPGMTSWDFDRMVIEGESESTDWPGQLVSNVRGSELNLIGRSAGDSISRLSWNPGDGDVWTLENLTQLATT